MSEEEKRAYCNFFNGDLRGDSELKEFLPMNAATDDFYKVIAKGALLPKFIKKYWPDVKISDNHDGAIAGAKQIGVGVTVSPSELNDGANNEAVVLEFVWQIIKSQLSVIKPNNDLKRILEPGEKAALLKPETIFLRWFNFHLTNHGHHRTVSNFTTDIKDAENYAVLLNQVSKETVSAEDLIEAFKEKDFFKRAEIVLRWAAKLGCRKFVTAQDIVNGNQRLNFAFVATIFHRYPALGPTSDEIATELGNRIEEVESLIAESILDKEDLESQINQTLIDFDSLTLELGDLQLEFDTITDERDTLRQEKLDLEALLSEVESDNAELTSEYEQITAERDELFAQLEAEVNIKVDLETLLRETKEEFESVKAETEDKISQLQKQLEQEIQIKTDFTKRLESTLGELEDFKAQARQIENDLSITLETEINEKNNLANELSKLNLELEETLLLADEAEKTKDDLFKLLNDTITDLETFKANAQINEEELRATLAAETAKKEEAHKRLQDKIAEYEAALAAWKIEREGLLKKIEALEKELEELKAEMKRKLEEAALALKDAIDECLAERERMLSDAENDKDAALGKVRLLLTGNTKQGYLWKWESGIVGYQWKKKFFVLRDNLLCWYLKEKHVTEMRPRGVIYCDEARIYDMGTEDISTKRDFVFQVDTGKMKLNLAADSQEEMKEWMTEIRVAKKKKLGVKAVSSETKKKK